MHFWDAETCESRGTFKVKDGARGIAAISVSPCLRYVACVDDDDDEEDEDDEDEEDDEEGDDDFGDDDDDGDYGDQNQMYGGGDGQQRM